MKSIHKGKIILTFLAFSSLLVSNVSAGGPFWEVYFGTKGLVNGFDVAYAVETHWSGKIYIAGVVNKGPIGGYDAFVASYDFFGNLLLEVYWGTRGFDAAYALDVDELGNIYIAGRTGPGPFGGDDAFVVCFDSSGGLRWEAFYGTAQYDRAHGVAVDPHGNVYIVGSIGRNPGPFDAFVASFNCSGGLRWEAFYGTPNGYEYGYAVDVDLFGNVYVAGRTGQGEVYGMPFDTFLISYDSSGNPRWEVVHAFSGICDWAHGVAVDSCGNIYIAGPTWNPATQDGEVFIASFNCSGGLRWEAFWGTPTRWEYARGIDVDLFGNVYVGGYAYAREPFQPDEGPFGGDDAFVVCFDSSGGLRWEAFWGTADDDQAWGVAVNGNKKVYIAGWTLSGPFGGYDAFLASLRVQSRHG
jgi:hypothetical protein